MEKARRYISNDIARPVLVDTENNERVALLCNSALFAGMPASECAHIAGFARTKVFMRNEPLFQEGQTVRHILLIKSGSVKLTQLSAEGSEVILWLNGTGETVGVMSLSASGCHTCSARAVAHCTALQWERGDFEAMLDRSPQMRNNVQRILTTHLNELQERFREVATERVARRVARILVRLLNRLGKKSDGGIEIVMSREELAQMTGTTLFSISRLMSEWEGLGLVSPRREAVLIIDPQRLAMVGSGPDFVRT